ncbi:MAG TPA: hypothetical protein VL992_21160 [Tepidisphaeraceae bacterium]|nr:hypothetical protein [Tepidisphaeraceae bacterium]
MRRLAVVCAVLAAAVWGSSARADSTVLVTPSDTIAPTTTPGTGWSLGVFDYIGEVALSGPWTGGTAAIVSGSASFSPPGGAGAVNLATASGGGDGAAAVATEQFDNTLLSSITALSYSAYSVTNNGQQFPYLALSVNTGAVDNNSDAGASANTPDTLFFEPPYQQPTTGNPSLPDQGATVMDEWQTWNALEGGFWDNNDAIGSGGFDLVNSIQSFLALYPDAYITSSGLAGLGGLALQVGFGLPTDNFDGYVSNLSVGINGDTTTFEFGPAVAAVPLPSTVWGGGVLLAGLGALKVLKRRPVTV